jgi:hypothetical protein
MALLRNTTLPIGIMTDFDPSDSRAVNGDGNPGSGVGFGKAPADSRATGTGGDEYAGDVDPHAGVMLTGNRPAHVDQSDRRFENAEGGPGSGGMTGAPLAEYADILWAEYEPVAGGPYDGGMPDPIRDGDTPSRPAMTRYLYDTEPVYYEISGLFAQTRELVGEAFRGAQQPYGRMNPMDEYRLLGDGSHG